MIAPQDEMNPADEASFRILQDRLSANGSTWRESGLWCTAPKLAVVCPLGIVPVEPPQRPLADRVTPDILLGVVLALLLVGLLVGRLLRRIGKSKGKRTAGKVEGGSRPDESLSAKSERDSRD
jgi:hypothetical protein